MRVMGPDRQEVRRIADQVKAKFREDPLLGAVHDDWLEPVPAMKLVIDQDRARALGVTSQRIRQMLQALHVRCAARRLPRRRRRRSPSSLASRMPAAACCPRCREASARCIVMRRQGQAWCRCLGAFALPSSKSSPSPPQDHVRNRIADVLSDHDIAMPARVRAELPPRSHRGRCRAMRRKARLRSPPRRRSCWPSSSCC